MNPDYGITKHLPETDYEKAIEPATAALIVESRLRRVIANL